MKPSNQQLLRPKASSATTSGVSSLPVLLARNLCCFNLLPNPNPTRTEFHYWLWVQKPLLWDLLGGSLSILHGLWPLMGQWQGKAKLWVKSKRTRELWKGSSLKHNEQKWPKSIDEKDSSMDPKYLVDCSMNDTIANYHTIIQAGPRTMTASWLHGNMHVTTWQQQSGTWIY